MKYALHTHCCSYLLLSDRLPCTGTVINTKQALCHLSLNLAVIPPLAVTTVTKTQQRHYVVQQINLSRTEEI